MKYEKKELEYLGIHLRSLFFNENERDLSRDFRYISDYYKYLSTCIDCQDLSINADLNLLGEFEAVHLWLKEKLLIFPESINNEVDKIFLDHNLCDIFSIISNLSKEHIYQIKRSRRINKLPKLYSIFGVKIMIPPSESEIINDENISQ